MIAYRQKDNPYIFLYLLMCIILNCLLLNYLYTPDIKPLSSPTPIGSLKSDKNSFNPTNYLLENVPLLSQLPVLPTGCEAAATTMLLQWAGVNVTMEEIANALPKGNLPQEINGQLIGGNPNDAFIGNPFLQSGLGVFNQPIADLIDTYLPHRSDNLSGCSFDELLAVINSNRPIVVWATINLAEPSINSTWKDETGKEVVWKVPEHSMVLIGYNETEVIVNDPLTGEQQAYNRVAFKNYWEYMGRQAVTIKPLN